MLLKGSKLCYYRHITKVTPPLPFAPHNMTQVHNNSYKMIFSTKVN